LWEAHPEATSAEVRDAIVESAHLFTTPNDSMGHGIPNFMMAHAILEANAIDELESFEDDPNALSVFPQPATDFLQVRSNWAATGERWIWRLYSRNGSLISQGLTAESPVTIEFSTPPESGTYILTFIDPSTGKLQEALPVIFVNR
jgi:hypothetical protein